MANPSAASSCKVIISLPMHHTPASSSCLMLMHNTHDAYVCIIIFPLSIIFILFSLNLHPVCINSNLIIMLHPKDTFTCLTLEPHPIASFWHLFLLTYPTASPSHFYSSSEFFSTWLDVLSSYSIILLPNSLVSSSFLIYLNPPLAFFSKFILQPHPYASFSHLNLLLYSHAWSSCLIIMSNLPVKF